MKLLRLLAAAGFAILLAAPLAPANAAELTEGQREEVGKLVEKYILENPEIIMQAIEKLRERQRLAEEEQLAVVAGSAFGAPGTVRVALTADGEVLREAVTRMERTVTRLPS